MFGDMVEESLYKLKGMNEIHEDIIKRYIGERNETLKAFLEEMKHQTNDWKNR